MAVKNKKQKIKNKKFINGVSVIELIVVVAILAITLTTILGMANFSLGIQGIVRQTVQAENLAKEAMEAIRNIRDNTGWNQITTGNHGLINSAGSWSFSGAGDTIGIFTRTISIVNAQRDASDNIVESGGVPDSDTKKITVMVSWSERGSSHEVKLITYLTNWK